MAHDPQALVYVLVHSPIVGPDTWEPVADELRRREVPTLVPELVDDGGGDFWHQHVASVVGRLGQEIADDSGIVLVAHSGAGQLLTALGQDLRVQGHELAAYLFVDAGLPAEGRCRLEQLRDEAPHLAERLQEMFRHGTPYPDWDEAMLTELVPDPERRAKLVAGIRHQPKEYWTEPIPHGSDADETPRGVLLLSDGYAATEEAARSEGWPVRDLGTGNHFQMLVDPVGVADELLALADEVMSGK